MLKATQILIKDLSGEAAHPLTRSLTDHDLLLTLIGDARFVLPDFYSERARIARRLSPNNLSPNSLSPNSLSPNSLSEEKGSGTVAERPTGPTRGVSTTTRGAGAPTRIRWMRWPEHRCARFRWMDTDPEPISATRRSEDPYCGLDVDGLHASIEAVTNYLDKVDPEGAGRARQRYACLPAYRYPAGLCLSSTCESEVVAQPMKLQHQAAEYAGRGGKVAEGDFFGAEQNARPIRNAGICRRATPARRCAGTESFALPGRAIPHLRFDISV